MPDDKLKVGAQWRDSAPPPVWQDSDPPEDAPAKAAETQFEQERKPENQRGFISTVGDYLMRAVPKTPKEYLQSIGTMMIPGAQTAMSNWEAGNGFLSARERGHGLGYSTAAGLGTGVGVDAERIERSAETGDTGGILGEIVIPTSLALSPLMVEGGARMRGALRNGAFEEFPNKGPKLTRGASRIARAGGTLSGAGLGSATGIPGAGYAGGVAGFELGPSLMESLLGTPELGDTRNPGPFSKLPMRTPGKMTSPIPRMGTAAELSKMKFEEPPKGRIVSPESKAPNVEGSYWSFGERALRRAVLGGDRDAAIVYKQRFGELPEGAGFLTDVGQRPTRGLYRSK